MSQTILDRLTQAIVAEDSTAFGALYHDDAVMHEPLMPEPARGRAAIAAGEQALFDAFGDISIDVRSTVANNVGVVAEVVLAATNDGPLDLGFDEPLPPTGRRIEVPMVWVLELDDAGLIREERDYFDTGLVMQQLGIGGQ